MAYCKSHRSPYTKIDRKLVFNAQSTMMVMYQSDANRGVDGERG